MWKMHSWQLFWNWYQLFQLQRYQGKYLFTVGKELKGVKHITAQTAEGVKKNFSELYETPDIRCIGHFSAFHTSEGDDS